jgi:alkylhydroperoxidase/carboxymuconolactone decarboxylase family protein YurZ
VNDPTTDRHEVAQATAKRIFNHNVPTDAKPWEPESMGELRRMFVSYAFTDVWTRTAIDNKTRCMVTVAILASLGLENELKSHIDGALIVGVTPDELADVFAQVSNYAGIPRAGEALKHLSRNLERRAARAAAGE